MHILSLLYISYCRPNREHPKTWNLLKMSVKAMYKYYGRTCEGDGILISYFLPQNTWFLFLKVLDTVCLSWFYKERNLMLDRVDIHAWKLVSFE